MAASHGSATRRLAMRMRATTGSTNAAMPHATPHAATGSAVRACTALANGESQTSAQCPPPGPQMISPPLRATTSSYH